MGVEQPKPSPVFKPMKPKNLPNVLFPVVKEQT
jgi:hypothetical protein